MIPTAANASFHIISNSSPNPQRAYRAMVYTTRKKISLVDKVVSLNLMQRLRVRGVGTHEIERNITKISGVRARHTPKVIKMIKDALKIKESNIKVEISTLRRLVQQETNNLRANIPARAMKKNCSTYHKHKKNKDPAKGSRGERNQKYGNK